MMESIGKMLGPACAAPLFAWAISSRPATVVPGGTFIVFFSFGLTFISLALLGTSLPRNVDSRAQDSAWRCRERKSSTNQTVSS